MVFAAGAGISVAMLLPKAVSALTGKVAQPYFVVAVLIGLLATVSILLIACATPTRARREHSRNDERPRPRRAIVAAGPNGQRFCQILGHVAPEWPTGTRAWRHRGCRGGVDDVFQMSLALVQVWTAASRYDFRWRSCLAL
ncbi:hypothetical protein ACU4GD_29810 [Cupriavidus basilensis]